MVSAFKKQVLKFIRPSPNSTFNVHNSHGIKLLTRLRVGLVICVNTNLCVIFKTPKTIFRNCGRHIELSTSFSTAQITQIKKKPLFDKISNIERSLLNQNDAIIVETFLFVSNGLNDEENTLIIESIS